MKESKWEKFKRKLGNALEFLVIIIIVGILLAGLIAPYYAVGQAVADGDLPWWVILFVR